MVGKKNEKLFFFFPGIKKLQASLGLGRQRHIKRQKASHWKEVFLSSGLPLICPFYPRVCL